EIAGRQLTEVGGGRDPAERALAILVGQLALLDLLAQRFLEAGQHGVGALLSPGPQHHFVAVLRRALGDARPHDPRPHNAHALDRHGRRLPSGRVSAQWRAVLRWWAETSGRTGAASTVRCSRPAAHQRSWCCPPLLPTSIPSAPWKARRVG